MSDGVITLRPFVAADRRAIVEARDDEWARWLGPGDPNPSPTAVIDVDGRAAGWIDVDDTASWLEAGEANVGYAVFPEHRGNGYAARALRLLSSACDGTPVQRFVLVIDAANVGSRRTAVAAGAVLVSRTLPHLPASLIYEIPLSSYALAPHAR